MVSHHKTKLNSVFKFIFLVMIGNEPVSTASFSGKSKDF